MRFIDAIWFDVLFFVAIGAGALSLILNLALSIYLILSFP